MFGKLSGWDDDIVAMATPPGVGAIGVIRLSGKNSIDIVNTMFPGKDLATQLSHTLHVGSLINDDIVLDQVVVSLYRTPKSYTGENIVEIAAHGSPYVQEEILKAILSKGVRIAKPGEFTQRAFLNGKLDLVQAEAVADLIESNTAASKTTALNSTRGGFSTVLKGLRDRLLSFSALIELELDFSQEDVEFAERRHLKDLIAHSIQITGDLIKSFALGNVVKNGVQVAIIGNPNAGKSTLMNLLLNENRSIVSDIAGTTRDTIEEELNIDGVIFKMIDTAGIRDNTTDVIEKMGVQRSMEKVKQADIIIYLFDVNLFQNHDLINAVRELELVGKKMILAGNKTDLLNEVDIADKFDNKNIHFMSALNNDSIVQLKDRLLAIAVGGAVNIDNTIVTNARHHEALKKVYQSLVEIEIGIESNLPGDLLSLDIRTCLYYLGEITGEITNEDQLDYIFSKFCIGK